MNDSQGQTQSRISMKRSSPSLNQQIEQNSGFQPFSPEAEPLSEAAFHQLPGNLKKSYLMMEIHEDKLQQRIKRLRGKKNVGSPRGKTRGHAQNSQFDIAQQELEAQYSYLSPLKCARNSKKYLHTDKKGNPFVDPDDLARDLGSKSSLMR